MKSVKYMKSVKSNIFNYVMSKVLPLANTFMPIKRK